MRRLVALAALALSATAQYPGSALAGQTARANERDDVMLRGRWLAVELEIDPSDERAEALDRFLRPLGTTRWDLTALVTGDSWIRTITRDASGDLVVRDGEGTRPLRARSIAPANAARDWLAPHVDVTHLSDNAVIERVVDGRTERLSIRSERVGSGWVYLPSRPYEVVLQRVEVGRLLHDIGIVPHRLFYRWVSPRFGVVAETEWVDDGVGAAELARASVIDRVLAGATGLRLYADRQGGTTLGFPVLYGFDRGTVPISSLDPAGHTTMQDLYSASSWDFSGNNLTNYPGMLESASTVSPINSGETCSANLCGFDRPGAVLGREDKNWDLAVDLDGSGTIDADDRRTTVSALEREAEPTKSTTWLRAVVRNQGIAGSFGSGESRLCYVDDGRQEVPLAEYRHLDAIGWYQQVGDTWSSGDNDDNPATSGDPFACENNTFNHVCPDPCPGTAFCQIYTKDCSGRSGTQFGEVLGEGPVTLPSGHTFNALVSRTVAEFCTYAGSSCFFNVQGVRTAVYLWSTPVWGTIVRVQSELDVSNIDTFTEADETDIKFGLFPPVSISVGAITDSSVEISWDPGLDTHRIDGYRVYWDTDSGVTTSYAFDQVVPAGQTSLVVAGLTPGTRYFFTVASMSDFTNPDTNVTTTYESILFPQSTEAVPGPIPGEVSATPGGSCEPTQLVQDLRIGKAAGGNYIVEWDTSTDPCVEGYEILGSAAPTPAMSFTSEQQVGGAATTSTIIPLGGTFIQVLGTSTSGDGPW